MIEWKQLVTSSYIEWSIGLFYKIDLTICHVHSEAIECKQLITSIYITHTHSQLYVLPKRFRFPELLDGSGLRMKHVMYEWVMLHMNESCHISIFEICMHTWVCVRLHLWRLAWAYVYAFWMCMTLSGLFCRRDLYTLLKKETYTNRALSKETWHLTSGLSTCVCLLYVYDILSGLFCKRNLDK